MSITAGFDLCFLGRNKTITFEALFATRVEGNSDAALQRARPAQRGRVGATAKRRDTDACLL